MKHWTAEELLEVEHAAEFAEEVAAELAALVDEDADDQIIAACERSRIIAEALREFCDSLCAWRSARVWHVAHHACPSPPRGCGTSTPPTSQELEIWEHLETARQQVRPVIKREVEGEPVTKELLNLRLKMPAPRVSAPVQSTVSQIGAPPRADRWRVD